MPFEVKAAPVPAAIIENRIVFNPNYGGRSCSVPGSCIVPIKERAMKPKFFAALRRNVAEHGFRNPIVVYYTPEGYLLAFGGSRLRVAKQLDITIPALIVDYVGDIVGERVTVDNWKTFFRDIPVYFQFTDVGVDTHYSLERNRRAFYDAAGVEWTNEADVDSGFLGEEFPWLSS